MDDRKLPPLPEPCWPPGYQGCVPPGGFTKDQMHAYARAALAAHRVAQAVAAERELCAKLCDVTPPYPFRPSIEAAHAIRNQPPATGK